MLETLAAELPKDTIRFSSKIVIIEEDGNLKLLHLANGSIIKAKVHKIVTQLKFQYKFNIKLSGTQKKKGL